jgi:broad specificity phosphatase PhoE
MNDNGSIIILIRHGEKLYSNSKGPLGSKAHDPPLVENSLNNVINKGSELIEKYGIPTQCIISPYLRTRQTAKYLLKSLEDSSDKLPQIIYDANISEYLGNQKPYLDYDGNMTNIPHVEEETLELGIAEMSESFQSLINRCKQVIIDYDINNLNNTNKKNIIWIVTHGIVISTIAKELQKNAFIWNIDIPQYKLWQFSPEYLEGLIINHNNSTINHLSNNPLNNKFSNSMSNSMSNSPLKNKFSNNMSNNKFSNSMSNNKFSNNKFSNNKFSNNMSNNMSNSPLKNKFSNSPLKINSINSSPNRTNNYKLKVIVF